MLFPCTHDRTKSRRWPVLTTTLVVVDDSLSAGAAAGLAHRLAKPSSHARLIGASGAVAATMGAFLVLFGSTKIRFVYWYGVKLGTFAPQAWVMLPLWLAQELLFGVISQGADGTAHFAHVGGFVHGVLFALGMRASGIDRRLDEADLELLRAATAARDEHRLSHAYGPARLALPAPARARCGDGALHRGRAARVRRAHRLRRAHAARGRPRRGEPAGPRASPPRVHPRPRDHRRRATARAALAYVDLLLHRHHLAEAARVLDLVSGSGTGLEREIDARRARLPVRRSIAL